MNIISLYRLLYQKIVGTFKPIVFAKKVGVNCKDWSSFHIYGTISWGSEPWIIKIGSNVHITHGVKFITHDGGTLLFRNIIHDLEITKPISIGDNVYIGNNVMLMPGTHVGNNVIIGAGSIVTHDIPDNSVVAGVPARVIKNIDDYRNKICRESLHLGHLKGKEKDIALKQYYNYRGKSKGIYF